MSEIQIIQYRKKKKKEKSQGGDVETSSSRLNLSSKNYNWNYGNLKKFLTYFLSFSSLKKRGLIGEDEG